MSLKAMYNNAASSYQTANRFGSISVSHECAIRQILKAQLGHKPHYKILDFGVGDGAFLQQLQGYLPDSSFTGIDISSEMLKHAKNSTSPHNH